MPQNRPKIMVLAYPQICIEFFFNMTYDYSRKAGNKIKRTTQLIVHFLASSLSDLSRQF